MEHLPLPVGAKHFIVAPYEAPPEKWYENKGFLTFPARRGWTKAQLRGGDIFKDDYLDKDGFSHKGTKQEIEQFFQTWLFFGLVIDVLKVGNVNVSPEDFLRQRGQMKAQIIDTTRLPQFLVKWDAEISQRGNLEETWTTLNEMFETAAEVLNRFCAVRDDDAWPLKREKPRPWQVRDEISTVMIAMAFTLRRAAIDVCSPEIDDNYSPWPAAARSEILTRRLMAKWCVADVTTTLKQLSIDGQYYLANSAGLDMDELDHHAKCIRAHCLYDHDLDMYVTQHTTAPYHKPNCREEITYGGHVGPERGQKDWVDAICTIIDKDAIPIALWNKGRREVWSYEYHFSGHRQPDFVAISHVWADGKGNPKANSLPECQIDKIQRLVEKVTWHGRREVPSDPYRSDGVGFWMDTLCLPAVDKARKDKAIATMRHVYSHARAVLVLDDWIQGIPSDTPRLDLVTRLYQSNWLKRLWTHQEGFLPKELWIQFSDRPIEIKEIKSWIDVYQKSYQAQGLHLHFPKAADMRLVGQYTFLTGAFKHLKDNDDKWVL